MHLKAINSTCNSPHWGSKDFLSLPSPLLSSRLVSSPFSLHLLSSSMFVPGLSSLQSKQHEEPHQALCHQTVERTTGVNMFQAFCTLQTAYTHTPNNNNNKEPLTPGLRLFAPTAFHTNNTNSLCASHLHSKQSNHLKAIKSHRKASSSANRQATLRNKGVCSAIIPVPIRTARTSKKSLQNRLIKSQKRAKRWQIGTRADLRMS